MPFLLTLRIKLLQARSCLTDTCNPVGFLADRGQQKAAYTFLAIAWGAVAVFKLFATHQFTDFAFGIANPGTGIQGLTRLAGFSSLAPAAAAYTLAV